MKEHLTTARRREIDKIYEEHSGITNRMLNSEGILIGKLYTSERDRSHQLNVVGEGYRYFLEHGVHPTELGMWIHCVFEYIAQQQKVPDVSGAEPILSIFKRPKSDTEQDCEVGPPPIQRW